MILGRIHFASLCGNRGCKGENGGRRGANEELLKSEAKTEFPVVADLSALSSSFVLPRKKFSEFFRWLPGLDWVGPSAQSLRDALWAPHLRSLRSLRRTMAHEKVLVLIQAGQPSD
jgi:hypothetical protein